jgi:hypothetical protein
MKTLVTLISAAAFALAAGSAFAADTAATKEAPKMAAPAKAEAKLMKPAGITEEAWNKMSDADKKKAADKAKADAAKGDKTKTAEAPKKEKKGGC